MGFPRLVWAPSEGWRHLLSDVVSSLDILGMSFHRHSVGEVAVRDLEREAILEVAGLQLGAAFRQQLDDGAPTKELRQRFLGTFSEFEDDVESFQRILKGIVAEDERNRQEELRQARRLNLPLRLKWR